MIDILKDPIKYPSTADKISFTIIHLSYTQNTYMSQALNKRKMNTRIYFDAQIYCLPHPFHDAWEALPRTTSTITREIRNPMMRPPMCAAPSTLEAELRIRERITEGITRFELMP